MLYPKARQLHALALAHADNASATVQALDTLATIWSKALSQNAHWLDQITQHGILRALAQLNDAASPTSG